MHEERAQHKEERRQKRECIVNHLTDALTDLDELKRLTSGSTARYTKMQHALTQVYRDVLSEIDD